MTAKSRLIARRSVLFGLGGLAGLGAVALGRTITLNKQIKDLDNPLRDFTVPPGLSLKKAAAMKGLIYGAAARHIDLVSDPLYADAIVQNCSMLVPEWELKWRCGNANLRPTTDSFDFAKADWMANFAATHDLLFRGHTLVWHQSLPSWFKGTVNNKNILGILQNHIRTVVGRYAGKVHSWDVVNEAIEPRYRRSDNLRVSPWLDLLGPNYIDTAFHLAAEADPNALLVYNDYDLDYDTPQADTKRDAVLQLLKRLRSNGVPIHALGIQAHLTAGDKKFSPEKLRQFLKEVASLGLKIMITEMDVIDKNLPVDINVRDRIVAGIYEDYLSVILEEPAVIAVITWGLSDKYTWLSEFEPRPDRAPVRTLPLDSQMQHKLAWNAIARAFNNAPKR